MPGSPRPRRMKIERVTRTENVTPTPEKWGDNGTKQDSDLQMNSLEQRKLHKILEMRENLPTLQGTIEDTKQSSMYSKGAKSRFPQI